jgi:solute carrier family 23 (nucleobase transporter), member 1
MIMFGMITAFGISALQHVDLKSARNLYIIGVSLFVPLVVCPWMQKHPGSISTGIEVLDSTLSVLLGTSILVGGALGCILDHSIPGTLEERGIIGWRKEISLENAENSEETKCYDIPYVMGFLKKCKLAYHVPFLPTYGRKQQ